MKFQIFNYISEAESIITKINSDFSDNQKNWTKYADVKVHPIESLFAVPIVEGFESYFSDSTELDSSWFESDE